MGQTACRACGGTNPATSTVKLDQTLLMRLAANPQGLEHFKADEAEREAAAERECAALAAAKEARLQREREEQERARCEEARRRLEAEVERERAREEAEAQQDRRRRQERRDADDAATAAAAAAAAAAEAQRLAAEEAQQRRDRAEAEAAAARAKRTAAQREHELAKRKVDVFLRTRGFGSVAAPRTRCFKTSYPLHVAVEENREDMVRALLLCGADTSVRNSAGKTPQELALRCTRAGSHAAILAIFVAAK